MIEAEDMPDVAAEQPVDRVRQLQGRLCDRRAQRDDDPARSLYAQTAGWAEVFRIATATKAATFQGTIAATNFSGSHSGTSSGTNTGDQTITLTGNVTGSGTGRLPQPLPTAPSLTRRFRMWPPRACSAIRPAVRRLHRKSALLVDWHSQALR